MNKKLVRALITLGIVVSLALPAMAATKLWAKSETTSEGNTIIWNPSGLIDCPGTQKIRLRSYTFDYGFFDSWGTTRFEYDDAGGASHVLTEIPGEHDGVVRLWNTGADRLGYFEVRYNGLSSQGIGEFSVWCY